MEYGRSIQTAFRFKSGMVSKMKTKAKSNGLSLNRYVEGLIERDLADNSFGQISEKLSDIKAPSGISDDILELSKLNLSFSKQELDADERLSYILSK